MAIDTIEVERTPEGALEFRAVEGQEELEGEWSNGSDDINVGPMERGVSIVGGSILLVRGLRQGGLSGFGSALLGGALLHRGSTGHSHSYEAFGIDRSTSRQRMEGGFAGMMGEQQEVRVEAVATINRPAEELFRFWREPRNLPRFMKSLKSVKPLDDNRAEWALKPPVGLPIHFVTEIVEETEGERIVWRSEESAVVEHVGEVRFQNLGDRGTVVRLELELTPPGGVVGGGIAKFFDGAMEMQLRSELKRLKQLMETGEIATTEGQPSGRD